jgi:hypothetical protein
MHKEEQTMQTITKVALDAMGGDNAPAEQLMRSLPVKISKFFWLDRKMW